MLTSSYSPDSEIGSLPGATYRRLHALKDVLFAVEGTEYFRWGIDVTLAGLSDERRAAVPRAYEPNGPAWRG